MSWALLWLEAPLQSWGADSRFGRRFTLPFPSRSGVLGLVCCALGRGGAQEEWLEKWRPLVQTIVAYGKKNSPPLLRDFQMVGSGYDQGDPWQDMFIPKKSDGTRSVGGGSKLTYRYYLQDRAFACALQLPDDCAGEVAAGLAAPAWTIYLGRKCCVPADIVFRGIFDDEAEALKRGGEIAAEKGLIELFRVEEGFFPDRGQVMALNDVPLAFGLQKKYRDRYVTQIPADDDNEAKEDVEMFESLDGFQDDE